MCTTEMMTFASMQERFAAANTALIGLSVDSNPSHIDWVRSMERYSWNGINKPKLGFPIIADVMGTAARLYGMLMPSASATRTVRSVFVIDPEGIIRAILIYPLTVGRNIGEILRLVLALQAYDRTGHPTPADWMPGGSQLLPAPQTVDMSDERLAGQESGGYSCIDWYLCLTQPGAAQQNMPPLAAASADTKQAAPMQTMAQPVSGQAQSAANFPGRPFDDMNSARPAPSAPAAMQQTPAAQPVSSGSIADDARSMFGRYRY